MEIDQIQHCPKCNAEIDSDSKFCTQCGAKIPEDIFKMKSIKEEYQNQKHRWSEEKIIIVTIIIILALISCAIAASFLFGLFSTLEQGSQQKTPTIPCVIDSKSDKITVVFTDYEFPYLKWADITITSDDSDVVWVIYSDSGIGTNNTMPSELVNPGDYLKVLANASGNVKFTFRYKPTNTLMGTWTVNV